MEAHFILTLGRSGSNTLCDLMNQNPEILNYGEVLGDWTVARRVARRVGFARKGDSAYLDRMLQDRSLARLANLYRNLRKTLNSNPSERKNFRKIRTIGVKDFSLNMNRLGLGNYLKKRPDIRIIGLQRHDVVDRMLSNAMLQKTGVVLARDGSKTFRRIEIPPESIHQMLETIDTENRDLDTMLRGLGDRVIRIDYEEFFSNSETCDRIMQEVFEFLKVARTTTTIRMKKIIQAPPSKVISNFDACLDALRGTAYFDLLRQSDREHSG